MTSTPATPPGVDTPIPIERIQAMADRFNQFLGRNGYRVGPTPILRYSRDMGEYGDAFQGYGPLRGGQPAAVADGQGVNFAPRHHAALVKLARRYGGARMRQPTMTPAEVDAAATLIHEMRHKQGPLYSGGGPFPTATPEQIALEEGSAQAAALDVLPALAKRLFGRPLPIPPANNVYPAEVTNLMHLSRFGSGAASARERAARVWRRDFQNADLAVRDQMAAAARQKRSEWGARTGR